MFYSLQKMFRSAPKAAKPAKRPALRLECLEARVVANGSWGRPSGGSFNNNHVTVVVVYVADVTQLNTESITGGHHTTGGTQSNSSSISF